MANTLSNFSIFDVEFFGGLTEVVEQAGADLFAGSGGTINMISVNQRGEFEKESFFKNIPGLVSRRDNTSIADISDLDMAQGEQTGVKLNTKIGPVGKSLDSFKKIGEDPSLMSFSLGQQYGVEVALDYVNTGLSAAATAMGSEGGMVVDIASDVNVTEKELSYKHLVKGLAAMGDRASRITMLVMPSKSHFDLVGESVASPVTNVGDIAIYEGTVGTMGRRVAVVDSPALIDDSADEHTTLMLTDEAITINQSEDSSIFSEIVLGKESLLMRLQGEAAHTITVKGFEYTGAASPTNAQLTTGANWSYSFSDVKSGPGVALITGVTAP